MAKEIQELKVFPVEVTDELRTAFLKDQPPDWVVHRNTFLFRSRDTANAVFRLMLGGAEDYEKYQTTAEFKLVIAQVPFTDGSEEVQPEQFAIGMLGRRLNITWGEGEFQSHFDVAQLSALGEANVFLSALAGYHLELQGSREAPADQLG